MVCENTNTGQRLESSKKMYGISYLPGTNKPVRVNNRSPFNGEDGVGQYLHPEIHLPVSDGRSWGTTGHREWGGMDRKMLFINIFLIIHFLTISKYSPGNCVHVSQFCSKISELGNNNKSAFRVDVMVFQVLLTLRT